MGVQCVHLLNFFPSMLSYSHIYHRHLNTAFHKINHIFFFKLGTHQFLFLSWLFSRRLSISGIPIIPSYSGAHGFLFLGFPPYFGGAHSLDVSLGTVVCGRRAWGWQLLPKPVFCHSVPVWTRTPLCWTVCIPPQGCDSYWPCQRMIAKE